MPDIDIVIDLSGRTRHAGRVNYLGLVGTMGAEFTEVVR
jgi:hypothetical protein